VFGCYWWWPTVDQWFLPEVDKTFELNYQNRKLTYIAMKSKENRFWRKKVKKRAYSITTQKSKEYIFFSSLM